MSSRARIVDPVTFEILTERLASASKRLMRPLSLIGVTGLTMDDAARAARDSDTVAPEGDVTWVLCPDTGVSGGAVLAARLVQMTGPAAKGVVVGFPHAVLDPEAVMEMGRSLYGDLAGVEPGQVLIARDEDGNLPIDLGDVESIVDPAH
jgi:hypothetical protein